MINVLLNINNFSEEFAFSELSKIINPNMKVLILPLSFHEDWITGNQDLKHYYGKGKKEYQDIAKEFYAFGINDENIKIINYFYDTRKSIEKKIKKSDILFLTGGYPDKLLYRIDKLRIRDLIQNFDGIVMGTSAGAMVQLKEYHVTPEEDNEEYQYHQGLGLIEDFDIEVHFENSPKQLYCIALTLQQYNQPIYALSNDSGLIIHDKEIISLGNAFKIT